MRERSKRWRVVCDRDSSQGPKVWLLGLYWRPHPSPQIGNRIYQCYVEFRVHTSNPFSLRHNMK